MKTRAISRPIARHPLHRSLFRTSMNLNVSTAGPTQPEKQLPVPALRNERRLPIDINYRAPGAAPASTASEMNNKSVVGTLLRNIVEISEHFATEVRQDESLRLDLCPVPQDVRVVQVESHGFAEEIAFGD